MKLATILSLVVTALMAFAIACGNRDQPPAPAPAPAVATPPMPAVPAPAVPAVPPAAALQSNFGTITLATGFTPDPHVAQGTSGGAINASTWNPTCSGWVSQTPDHIFVAPTVFANLRFLINSAQDTTLVIQKPDGTYLCADDTEGLNPIVQGAFPPGTYKLWIGSYEQGASAAYRLGVTELSSTTAASLGT